MRLESLSHLIEVLVTEVVPQELPSAGDLRLEVRVSADLFSGATSCWVQADEMAAFASALSQLSASLQGTAQLRSAAFHPENSLCPSPRSIPAAMCLSTLSLLSVPPVGGHSAPSSRLICRPSLRFSLGVRIQMPTHNLALNRTLAVKRHMPASEFVKAVDEVQCALRPSLKEHGFKVRGRTFNRVTEDGLTQVINLQMGSSDPPGTTYIPGLRENMHGLFTVNLGVYIPEVAEWHGGGLAKSWVQEYYCTIRSRLGPASGTAQDLWWHAHNPADAVADIQPLLLSYGLLFLDRFRSRDLVLSELDGQGENLPHCSVPRIVCAIILTKRGHVDAARALMAAQALESRYNRNHPTYVRELAWRLGLGAV